MRLAIAWPEGKLQVTCRNRLRCGKAIGGVCEAMVSSGSMKRGVEIVVSMILFGFPAGEVEECRNNERHGAARQVIRIGERRLRIFWML